MARTGKTLLNEKVRNQINSFYKRNNKYEEDNEDNPKSELQLQIEKLVINCYQKSQELNNDCYIRSRNKYTQDNSSKQERIIQLHNHIVQQDMKITQLDERIIKQHEEANQMINYNTQLAYYWQNSYFILNEEF
ncbi:hypothetical protein RhiirA4_475197 [Rhizophagus irregularis]|uniref:Uncharacterized protein n=1 Tax=Rhizophagus irregularis TaxID=588596 RepID=A0A2I1H9T6_9GLOM|nr:hypothetical protein RhiirA4_475197 [Rhizophagus irregularis]